ncbi:hypothetical protein PVAND_013090 [Polypedilum vanderplanki]|uniref:Zinc finger protein n=1 Tax=Polypedilum vanderplanki TaxID=319348 RepID=A0A9J6CQE2_POLVA|nr:hypothetical protein PVAND_013090 [Polypedilum vanderplanki]
MDSTNFKKPVLIKSVVKKKQKQKERKEKNSIGLMAQTKNCCRLCLAPETECVEIFKTQAADKQPIHTKIVSCVQIQVSSNDRLSVNICHGCVSYLNSWQSFKNRCDAAQRKQRIWLSTSTTTSSEGKVQSTQSHNNTGQSLLKNQLNGHGNLLKPAIENAQQRFKEKQAELQRKKLEELVQQQSNEIDTSFIKSEPATDDEDEENVMELDPTQFLAQGSSDEESEIDHDQNSSQNGDGPPILTSLGLTHINSVSNPFASYANSDDSMNDDKSEISSNGGKSHAQVPANCSVCNMQFSNRANARRHEKNIHKIRSSSSAPSSQLQQTNTLSNIVQNSSLSMGLNKKKPLSSIDIDYTKPELYRHLLTPTKLTFILNNLNFLEQAQDMICKCCNKKFPSYKFFMGHMRKKYHGLPRNICFKCLRQFDSKGQFIGHLKRPGGSCPNLYRLVMADDSIPKNLIPSDTNLRIPAKDVLNNRVYACAICDDTFRLKSDFREHVYSVHLEVTKNRETPNASCINCNEAFTDSAVRRRHFNNLDCIVYIVCNTCGEQFPSQSVYLEHVYQTHLNSKENESGDDVILFEEPPEEQSQHQAIISPSNKSIQKCPVCSKQYNNYYNVLRHMEAKHPDQVPQTYQCPECPNEKFSKQTYLREHLVKIHNKVDVSPRQLMQHQINNNQSGVHKLPAYTCKAPNCSAEFREKSKWLDHQVEQHNGQFWCMFCNYHEAVSGRREEFEKHLEMIHQNSSKPTSIAPLMNGNDSDDDASNNKLNQSDATTSFKCRLCAKRIATKTGLQKHMIKVHNVGGELVKCTLCPADFANDKGLKVHLWRCHEIREADYESVLPPDLLDPYTQQQRKLKQEEEQKSIVMANESGKIGVKRVIYECPFCHIVYHSKDELIDHQKTVHAIEDVDPDNFIQHEFDDMNDDGKDGITNDENAVQEEEAEYWFQCRFCQRSFNSGKKLTIHMNSHQESSNGQDENGGYPCKECNIVYKSKKSLWVHRHKKHPRIPVPSPCDACEKTFFDRTELIMHMQQAHPGSIPNESQKENESESLFTEGHWLLDTSTETSMKAPQPISEQNSQTFPKKRKRPAPSETPDGQFACDMCPKCFSNANALQVHRGWHFRSPDGRKVKDPSQMWHPDQVPPSKIRRTAPVTPSSHSNSPSMNNVNTSVPPTCPHCNTKFASHNNLRRHIVEVHKSRDSNTTTNESDAKVDRVGECTRCDKTFSTVAEWVDHKINDAKNRKAMATGQQVGYEWNCEICLKPFTRRERLMQHMLSHLNDKVMDPNVLAEHRSKVKLANGPDEVKQQQRQDSSSESESDEQSDDDDDEDDDQPKVTNNAAKAFSCDLCNVNFPSSQELRAHVAEHFMNGSSMTSTPSATTRNAVENEDEESMSSENNKLDIDEDVERELNEVEFEEAEVDFENQNDEDEDEDVEDEEEIEDDDENSSTSGSLTAEAPKVIQQPQQPIARIQVQLHRCRICNAAFIDQYKSVECMMSHQKPQSNKCSDCQLYFKNTKQLEDHENLCHS